MDARTPPRGLVEAKTRIGIASVGRPRATAKDVAKTVGGPGRNAIDLKAPGGSRPTPAKRPTRG